METLSDYYAMDADDRKIYDATLRRSRDNFATLESAKVEGRAEGVEQAKFETARNLLAMGMDTDVILKATGLTAEDIEILKN